MENVIVRIQECSPEAVQEAKQHELKTSQISHAAELFKTFAAEDDSSKVKMLEKLAIHYGLTTEEFKQQCKDAQDIADTADKANGFVPNPNAKGGEKYGPKRRVLNQRLSEAKQLFGVFKQEPAILQEKGYWSALDTARTFLKEKGLSWDGNTKDAIKAKRTHKQAQKVMEEVMQALPMEAGESMADYTKRLAVEAEKHAEEVAQKQYAERVIAEAKKVIEKHGDECAEDIAKAMLQLLGYDMAESAE